MGGNDLVIDGVGTCVEGEVFGVLSSLYEEWRSCPYKDAPGLDPDFEWSEEADYLELLGDDFAAEEDEYYGVDAFDAQCGNIIEKYLAKSGCEGNFEERKKELTAIFFSFNFLWAVTLCVKNGNCNTLLLEKEMCIDYGKTMAIIDAMEAFRLVQPFYVTGNKNRKVLPLAIEFLLHRAKQAFEVLKTFFEKVLLDKGKLSDFVDGYSLAELRKEAYMLCACLTPRQMECLEMRYGLKDGVCRSIDEVGRYFGVTRERVRQIEAKAFKKLLKIFRVEFLGKVKAVVIGHAVGDALGVPVEFASREELDKAPVTDMEGYGTYSVPAGAWSDDTSMSLCTLDVLGRYGLDYDGVMINFGKWYYNDEFTPTGEMFDVGNTCSIAIENYVVGKKSYLECGRSGERDNGNGSLMRIHPVVLYLANKDMPIGEKIEIVHTMSALTHAHDRSRIGCGIYAFILWELLQNPSIEAMKVGLEKAADFYQGQPELVHYKRLFERTFIITPRNTIKSGGYIVDTLEAAVWCLLTTNSYKDAVLKAVNLGDDTDTVAAVTGGLAGALYGYNAIPEDWRNTLIKREYIENLCEQII